MNSIDESTYYTVPIRACVGCVTCDIPASRKICGFLSHAATKGCNKCTKEFTSLGPGSRNYAGFDRENLTMRSFESHKQQCNELLETNTKRARVQVWCSILDSFRSSTA